MILATSFIITHMAEEDRVFCKCANHEKYANIFDLGIRITLECSLHLSIGFFALMPEWNKTKTNTI